MKEPLPMNADTAKRIAKNKLPCTCGYKSLNDVWIERSDHVALCPAYFRETISLALLEAARMPTREQLVETLLACDDPPIMQASMNGYEDRLARWRKSRREAAEKRADAILAAWSKPQEDGT